MAEEKLILDHTIDEETDDWLASGRKDDGGVEYDPETGTMKKKDDESSEEE